MEIGPNFCGLLKISELYIELKSYLKEHSYFYPPTFSRAFYDEFMFVQNKTQKSQKHFLLSAGSTYLDKDFKVLWGEINSKGTILFSSSYIFTNFYDKFILLMYEIWKKKLWKCRSKKIRTLLKNYFDFYPNVNNARMTYAWTNFKCFFSRHFSSSFLGQKYYFFSHIQFWPGRPKLSLSYIGC